MNLIPDLPTGLVMGMGIGLGIGLILLHCHSKRMWKLVVEWRELAAGLSETAQALKDLTQLQREQLIAAYRIINVLTMMDIDRKEPWPDALQWLERNEEFKPQPTNQTEP